MIHFYAFIEYCFMLTILGLLYLGLSFLIPISVDDFFAGIACLALYNSIIAERRAKANVCVD